MTGKEIMEEEFERAGMRGGYKAEQVDAFLQRVATYVDELTAQNNDLNYKIQILADKIEEYKADEENIREALLGAQKLGNTMLNEAKAKVEAMTREAKAASEDMMVQARAKIDALTRESKQKTSMELSALKRECDMEQRNLEKIKQEVSNFKAFLLKQYKAQLQLLTTLPSIEERTEPKEPVPPEPAPEQEAPPVEFASPAYESPDPPAEPESEELPEAEEIAAVDREQTKEFGDPTQPFRQELDLPEQETPEPVKAGSRGRQSYLSKFGELKFGDYNSSK